jgi:hypothetical protein
MVNKAVSAGTLLNPPRLMQFLDAATKSLTTDPGISRLTQLFRLARQMQDIGLGKVQFFTVPFTTYEPDPNRLALGENADKLWDQLRHDRVLTRTLTSGAAKASQAKPGSGKKTAEERADAAANGLCA